MQPSLSSNNGNNSHHCADLAGDRKLGARWERKFCELAARYDKTVTAHQLGRNNSATAWQKSNGEWRHIILPDVTVWTSPVEHHEIKHKNPKNGGYGLEEYRLESLLRFAAETREPVFYTIHDWSARGRDSLENRSPDWVTCEIGALKDTGSPAWFPSYSSSETKRVPGRFWPVTLWRPLVSLWVPF